MASLEELVFPSALTLNPSQRTSVDAMVSVVASIKTCLSQYIFLSNTFCSSISDKLRNVKIREHMSEALTMCPVKEEDYLERFALQKACHLNFVLLSLYHQSTI